MSAVKLFGIKNKAGKPENIKIKLFSSFQFVTQWCYKH